MSSIPSICTLYTFSWVGLIGAGLSSDFLSWFLTFRSLQVTAMGLFFWRCVLQSRYDATCVHFGSEFSQRQRLENGTATVCLWVLCLMLSLSSQRFSSRLLMVFNNNLIVLVPFFWSSVGWLIVVLRFFVWFHFLSFISAIFYCICCSCQVQQYLWRSLTSTLFWVIFSIVRFSQLLSAMPGSFRNAYPLIIQLQLQTFSAPTSHALPSQLLLLMLVYTWYF